MTGSLWRVPSREHLEHLDTDMDVRYSILYYNSKTYSLNFLKKKNTSTVYLPLKKLTPRIAG